MAKNTIKHAKKAGLPPGTLVHVGKASTEPVLITVIDYDQQNFTEIQPTDIQQCLQYKQTKTVSWINIDGIHDVSIVESMGQQYDIHPLVMEDILNTTQRPKIEDFENYMYIVFKMLSYDTEHQKVDDEQVSLIMGKNFVISFQERKGDVFEQIRERIRSNKGRVRKMDADYLAYALVDAVVDSYFLILEKLSERVENLEESLVANPSQKDMNEIHKLKRELITLRKSVWPLREAINSLERSESPLIQTSTHVYLRDLYDHTIQVIDTIETLRDMVTGMLDIYLSSISNRMNSVMKVLTIIATIFIPLTFIAGIYGMNFRFMPELDQKWGYPAALIVMFAIAVFMLFIFRKKKWL